MPLKDKIVLITGGTGSFGRTCVRRLLAADPPRKIIIFSRDELKQSEMQAEFTPEENARLRFFLGDVRDPGRLRRAFRDVNIVIHAAALKQVPSSEYNPLEAIKTNIIGAANVIEAAIDQGVERTIALSTDKAANPVNLYGATKLCADKLFIDSNSYAGTANIRFSIVRYGNVIGSRGSVIPFFRKKRASGVLPLTDERMTRFWITLEQGVEFVFRCLDWMQGGEIFVPKIPSMKLTDLTRALAPECRWEIVGIRPGEKLHETLIPAEDTRHTYEFDDHFVIWPEFLFWPGSVKQGHLAQGRPVGDDFKYTSDNNPQWLDREALAKMVGD